jgi:hypothetical protein
MNESPPKEGEPPIVEEAKGKAAEAPIVEEAKVNSAPIVEEAKVNTAPIVEHARPSEGEPPGPDAHFTEGNRRVLRAQLVLFFLHAAVVLVCGWGRLGNWPVCLFFSTLALTALGPLVSAWDRRAAVDVAVGYPLLSLLASHVAGWFVAAFDPRNKALCEGPHVPCEGLGMFFGIYIVYAPLSLFAAALLGGLVRGVAILVVWLRRRYGG